VGKISLLRFFIITVVLAVAITFIELSVIVMNEYKKTLWASALLNTEQVTRQTAGALGIYVQEATDNLKLLNHELQNSMSRNEASGYMHSMVKIQTRFMSAMVYDENGRLLECGVDGIELRGDVAENSSFFPELFTEKPFGLSPPHRQNMLRGIHPEVITLGLQLTPNLYRRKAYLAADIRVSPFLSFIDDVDIGADGYCFVVDGGGNVVYRSAGRETEADAMPETFEEGGTPATGNRFIFVAALDNCDWKVVGVSYTDKMINSRIFSMLRFVLLSLVLCILLVILSTYVFFRNVHRPLKELSEDITAFGLDTLSFRQRTPGGVSEVRNLSKLFGQTAERVRELTERIKRDEENLRKTELHALQSQINPHFLYNTLDSIQWICEQGRTGLAADMIGALARLFRISISKGRELIPISREIEHAKSYLMIQGYRFEDSFTYKFDIDPDILPFLCNKITLQPIIENAIIHGFEFGERGEIVISGREHGGGIMLAVRDNGVGIPPGKLGEIFTSVPRPDSGIGLRNINDRIKIYFGEEYGLSVESTEAGGTVVSIFIPKTLP
jgi:two-component system sensor histidine kinase YesM